MTKRKLFWLLLVFVIYEILVWGLSILLLSDSSLVIGVVLTACGITVGAVYWLVARLSAAQTAPSAAGTASQPGAAPGVAATAFDEDGAAISAIIREANGQLAKSPTLASQRIKSQLADFPLYLVVGSEGSGKTSLFLASMLEPELLAGQVYQDAVVAPTRLGNIWFAAGAIIVEAAGFLFSGDGGRWSRFVAAFNGLRRKSSWAKLFSAAADSNLAGVVLCCDAAAFVGIPDAAKLNAMARVAQQRLRTLAEQLSRDVAVYVVFTKSDSIRHFGDYCARLNESEDQQILGCTLGPAAAATDGGVYAEQENARISSALNALYLSLAEKRLAFLPREKDPARRPGVYEFPREFKRIRSNLAQFLVEVFRPNPLQPNPVLNGFYFTGTRKVAESAGAGSGSILDRTVIHKVGDVTRMLRAEDIQKLRSAAPEGGQREAEVTRWTFAAEFWFQVLRSRRVQGATYVNRREQAYRRAAFATIGGVSALATALFLISFFYNHSLVHDLRSAALETEPVQVGLAPSLKNLHEIDTLRNAIEEVEARKPNVFLRLGFYNGNKVTDEAALRVYADRFREYFLNPIVARLESELSGLPAQQSPDHSYTAVYTNLRLYRTITYSRREPEANCAADLALTNDLVQTWNATQPRLDAEGESIARSNIQYYLRDLKTNRAPDELRVASKDQEVIQRSRDYLNAFRGIEPQYQGIIDQVNRELQSPASLQNLLPEAKLRGVLREPEAVPAAFTKQGWSRVQDLIANSTKGNRADSCVLGGGGTSANPTGAPDVSKQLRDRYVQDYIQHWSDFLTKVSASLIPYSSCADAAGKLDILKDNTSPILAALMMTADNTSFAKSAPSHQPATGTLQQRATGLRNLFGRVKSARPGGSAKPVDGAVTSTSDDIAGKFQPAQAVFATSPPNHERWIDPRNEPYLDALGSLAGAMKALDHGGTCDASDQAANAQASGEVRKAQDAVDKLSRNFDNQESYDSVKKLLEAPIQMAARLITTDPAEVLKGKINGGLRQFCGMLTPLKTKSPFSPKSRDEASLEMVGQAFNPTSGGLAVLRQALGDLVQKSPGGWTQRPDAPVKLSLPFLQFFNHMSEISDALYGGQGAGHVVHYRLSIRPNPAVRGVTLNGEPFPASGRDFTWPPANQDIDLRVVPAAGGSTPLRRYSGIWGVFQLLMNAQHEAGTNLFRFTNVQGDFQSTPQTILADGSAIVIEVSQFPNGVQRAFDHGFFDVSCPGRATN